MSDMMGPGAMPQQNMQMPWYLDMANAAPGLAQTSGLMAFRGSNTILRGGHAKSVETGIVRGVRQNLNPLNMRNWTRMASDSYFDGSNLKNYSPFSTADMVNAAGRGLTNEAGVIGRHTANTKVGKGIAGLMKGDGQLMARGSLSRLTAGAKVMNMSDRKFAKHARLAQQGKGRLRNVGTFLDEGTDLAKMGKHGVASRLMTSGQGAVTGRMGGFLAQASAGEIAPSLNGSSPAAKKGMELAARWGDDVARAGGTKAAGKQVVGRGVGMVARKAAAKTALKGGALMAARIGLMAVPGVNVVMAAWAAFDIAKLAVKGVGHITKSARQFGSDAKKSFQGGLNTGIMGQGFKDNEVSISSRARGVAAIQNSRLNARSILGAEAASMHAHFG